MSVRNDVTHVLDYESFQIIHFFLNWLKYPLLKNGKNIHFFQNGKNINFFKMTQLSTFSKWQKYPLFQNGELLNYPQMTF